MTPLVPLSLEYRLGLTSDPCPHCGRALPEAEVIQVNGATVVDHYEAWMMNRDRRRKTEKILVVCVEVKE